MSRIPLHISADGLIWSCFWQVPSGSVCESLTGSIKVVSSVVCHLWAVCLFFSSSLENKPGISLQSLPHEREIWTPAAVMKPAKPYHHCIKTWAGAFMLFLYPSLSRAGRLWLSVVFSILADLLWAVRWIILMSFLLKENQKGTVLWSEICCPAFFHFLKGWCNGVSIILTSLQC